MTDEKTPCPECGVGGDSYQHRRSIEIATRLRCAQDLCLYCAQSTGIGRDNRFSRTPTRGALESFGHHQHVRGPLLAGERKRMPCPAWQLYVRDPYHGEKPLYACTDAEALAREVLRDDQGEFPEDCA